MSWRYAVTRKRIGPPGEDSSYWYSIREVYTIEGRDLWTEDEIAASAESPEQVREVLRMMLADAELPVLDISDEQNAYWVE